MNIHGGKQGRSVLFLDVEGGFGGSSRSMYYLIRHLDRKRISPVAVIRKVGGEILKKYAEANVPCVVMPELPTFRPGERKRPVAFFLFLFQLRRFDKCLRKLRRVIDEYKITQIHSNIESMACTAYLLSIITGLPWTCHIRTMLVPGFFARFVCRLINASAAACIFITDQNLTHFAALVGRSFRMDKSFVVFNSTPLFNGRLSPYPSQVRNPDCFKVISLSNLSYNRGVDRIVDVAKSLRRLGREDFVFLLYGKGAHTKLLSRKRENSYVQGLERRVAENGLEKMIVFMGHIPNPERAVAGADALIKLARDGCPWGRDLMEALSAGVPAIALGAYERFVENDVNGYLSLHFMPDEIACFLISIKDDCSLAQKMSKANREKAARLFDCTANARKVEEVLFGVSIATL